jgi:hypothetical protein
VRAESVSQPISQTSAYDNLFAQKGMVQLVSCHQAASSGDHWAGITLFAASVLHGTFSGFAFVQLGANYNAGINRRLFWTLARQSLLRVGRSSYRLR